ncbi:hypothetical protein [Streptomyces qinglanensis]|uniref:Uncharacterized protein n=1 Tax=Streptomyces qinglanensis TaxID=943816 RepID=A0A1H9SA69_9ACTN|nr:hypothetical protein [Streptomyces qinglanensis]SER81485.1 hypothetical protein SAMN05421870_104367 [Streptomyces qinglanensis]
MSRRRSLVWLGLTPEPERELPPSVAALRSPPTDSAAERRRLQRLILHGSERRWLRYLDEVADLVTRVANGTSPGDRRAARLAAEVILDHHRMLIGLPGTAYARTAGRRRALESALRDLHAGSPASGGADEAEDTAPPHDAATHPGGHA